MDEKLFIPLQGGLAVALPKAFGMLSEALQEQGKLLGLRAVHALVDCVHDLGGLIDHGKRCADWGIGAAFANLRLRGAADTHASLGHVLHQRHQGL